MSLSPFQPGFRVGRYELLSPIARGGMAVVWAARLQGPRGFEKLVAIKTILPHLANDPRFETMFLDEARIAAEIVHPNVAQVFDLGEQDGVLYLICEWVEGEPLSTLRRTVAERGERIPIPIVLRIMADVCAGLHAAHELCDARGRPLQVVHRDVSPSNIVISDAGAVKVIDFGVAKAINRVRGETVAGKLKGKVPYMAPEQARGAAVDRRADVWGVGAVLYQLLSGRLPYEADSALAVLDLVLSRDPPPPLPSDIPVSVAEVVTRAMQLEPEDRYPTAAEMQLALVMALRDVSMPVTNAAIAAYVHEHLAPQADHRRRLVKDAIEAANAAPPLDSDMTLVEYVTKCDIPKAAGSSVSSSRDLVPESPVVAPAIHERAVDEELAEEPEPVPLVRRSKPEWRESDPEMERGLSELRSLVQHTLPPSVVPPPLVAPVEPPPSVPPSAPPSKRRGVVPSRLFGAIVVILVAAGTIAVALPVLSNRGTHPAATATTTGAPVPLEPSAVAPLDPIPASSAATPNASATASAVASATESTVKPPVDDVPPRIRGGSRTATTVPLPPPGWESLPSITLDPDSPEAQRPAKPRETSGSTE